MLSRLCLTSSFQEDAQGSDTASLLSEPAARGGRQRAGGISNELPFSLSTATYRASRVPLSGSCSSARFSNALRGRKEGEHTFPLPPSLVNVFSVGRCLAPGFRRGHVGTLGPSREHPGGRQTRREALTLSVGRRGRAREKLARKPSVGTSAGKEGAFGELLRSFFCSHMVVFRSK